MTDDVLAPYVHDRPVERPALFVGRREQVAEMASRVRRGESFAVLAGTRMGKTSLLLQLQAALRARPESPTGRSVVPLLLSTHQFGRLRRSAVFAAILDGLRRAVAPALVDDLAAAVREIRIGGIEQDVAFEYFSSVLVDLLREDDRLQLFVALDETDEFQAHEWSKVFFSNLRFLISQSEIRRRVNVLIAGTLSSAELWNTAGSPFYNVVTIVDLTLLDDGALSELIPVGFPAGGLPADVERDLLREVGGHPYLMQYYLHHLWQRQRRCTTLTRDDVRAAGDRFVRERRGDFQRWWAACGPAAQTLFGEIARSRDRFKKRTAIEVFADVDTAERALDELTVNGLVREVQRNRFRAGSRLFARWAGERRPSGSVAPPGGTVTAEDPLPSALGDLCPIWEGRLANRANLTPGFYTRLGARLAEVGDPFLAVDALQEAAQRWPEDRAVILALGRARVACGAPWRALEGLAPLLEGGHTDGETLSVLATAELAVADRLQGEAAVAARAEAVALAGRGIRHAEADGHAEEAARCRAVRARALGERGDGVRAAGPAAEAAAGPGPFACVALAGGEELDFAESLLDRAGTLYAVLPCPAEVLTVEVGELAGPRARERLAGVLRRAVEIEVVGDHKALENPLAIPYARRIAAGLARLRGGAIGRRFEDPGAPDPGPLVRADGAYRIVGLLFADAERFSDLDDAQNRAFGQRYLPAVAELAQRSAFAPVVRNTWGDGLYMVFHELDHAARFAAELRDAVDTPAGSAAGLPEGIRLRIGLHAGPTHALTDPVTGQFTYMGRHVSLAARIEQGGEAGHVVGSAYLVALTQAADGAAGEWEYAGRTELPKGAGALALFRLAQSL